MEILLDTTAQIERIFKRKRKLEIEHIISENDCGSSTFVLGEYKSNMVKDFITLYNIMQIEDTVAGVRENINDTVFNRSFERVYYVFNDLCKTYNEDYALIREELRTYAKRLEVRFKYGLKSDLFNETDCHRAKAEIVYQESSAGIPGISCTKLDDFCKSCEFIAKHIEIIKELKEKPTIQEKMKKAMDKIIINEYDLKGNTCRSLGDCIISLEALKTSEKKICTTNIDDFRPICDHIGVDLCEMT